ncbi:hypothetical protein QE152_g27852 [Popillia japonica]|uniref:Uncharacterized protein n=1 Tax=Popillia japonica TaxID=7064 RepID=A0AAW1JKE4_POPJA
MCPRAANIRNEKSKKNAANRNRRDAEPKPLLFKPTTEMSMDIDRQWSNDVGVNIVEEISDEVNSFL